MKSEIVVEYMDVDFFFNQIDSFNTIFVQIRFNMLSFVFYSQKIVDTALTKF